MLSAITYIDKQAERFWRSVARSVAVAPESLGLFRILFGLFMLLLLVPHTYWLSGVPQAFFDPPFISFANLLNDFPPAYFFYGLDILGFVLLAMITLGVKARAATLAFFFVGIIGSNFLFSFGKIDHSIMLWALTLCMVFSGWGKTFALLPDKPSRWDKPRFALSLMAVFIAFGMFTAGFQKAFFWLDFNTSTSGFLNWFYVGYYTLERTELLAPVVLLLPTQLFELADYTAVLFELSGFVFLLLGRKSWRLWLLAAAAFHLVNTVTLNIGFSAHFLVYLVFVDFTRFKPLIRWASQKVFKQGVSVLVVALVAVRIVRLSIGQGSSFLFFTDPVRSASVLLYVSALLWLIAFAVLLSDLRGAANARSAATQLEPRYNRTSREPRPPAASKRNTDRRL